MALDSILITGGNGNIGRLVTAKLIAAGTRVISFDIPDTKPAEGVEACILGDIRDHALLAEILDTHKPQAILHLASLLSGSSEANPAAAWEINATASTALMQMASERGIGPFVFASTIATYATDFPEVLPQDAPQWPSNVYGATKVAVERFGYWLKTTADMDFRCIRFPMVLSPYAPPGAVTAYPSHAVVAASKGEAFTFPVSPETGMSTLYLEDVILSIVAFLGADRAALTQPAYNVHAFTFTAGELADHIKGVWPDAQLDFAPEPALDALVTGWPNVVEDAAARADWGWTPAYDFDACMAALKELVEASNA